jgi:Undecaprenyl-phosphate glucose phosphotransferase
MELRRYLLRIILLITDFFIINISFLLAPLLTFGFDQYLVIEVFTLFIFNLSWVVIAVLFKMYSKKSMDKVEGLLQRTVNIIFVQLAFYAILLLIKDEFKFRLYFHTCWILVVMMIISRFFITYLLDFLIVKANRVKKIVIVGLNDTGLQLASYFHPIKEYSVIGFFDNNADSDIELNINGHQVLGKVPNCMEYVIGNNITEIYSTIMPSHPETAVEMNALVESADRNCIRIKFVAGEKETEHYRMPDLGGFSVISLRAEPLHNYSNGAKKRLFDIAISLLVLVFIMSWLTPIIAILIKLESTGPIFFQQLRSGRNNVPFMCYKFRSMTVNNKHEHKQASKNDERITRIGAFLRKTSLDEFPQFFNVLIGQMSIVGPRPHMLKHTEQYSEVINKYMVRQFLKPGITGWAQVHGYRGETRDNMLMEKRVEYDMWYMENWSLMLDVRILFMTIINIFKGDANAY